MPKASDKTPQIEYKTEEQLKIEAKARAEAEVEAASERPPKTAAQQKRENFWYHYKWHTIAGVFLLALAVFFAKDIFFSANPDITVILVSESYISDGELDRLKSALERAASDCNNDRKVIAAVDYIALPAGDEAGPNPADSQQEYASTVKLVTVMSAGIDPVYLLDDASYEYITAMADSGEEEEDLSDGIFEADFVSAELLFLGDPEGSGAFLGMRFYLRQGGPSWKNKEYYDYCNDLLRTIEYSSYG